MQIQVRGTHMDVGESFSSYIQDQISSSCEKFFNHTVSAQVGVQPDVHNKIKADILISVGNGIVLQASAVEVDPYPAFDTALEKIVRQLRKYKDRLQDHHKRMEASEEMKTPANQYVIEAEKEESSVSAEEPIIIAEMQTTIETLSVSEAVMRLDLSGLNAIMFRNRSHNGLNMIYKRTDGNIGWIDPDGNQAKTGLETKAAKKK